ncbi:hypothetical protein DP42_5327 [Burkholderia pseudomallei]|nr:hypothetical protein DP42_5327 [Burkholderia pseudomallei]
MPIADAIGRKGEANVTADNGRHRVSPYQCEAAAHPYRCGASRADTDGEPSTFRLRNRGDSFG